MIYNSKIFIIPQNYSGHTASCGAKDIYMVDTCDNLPGRTNTILFCTNIVTGEKKEYSSGIIEQVLPETVERLLKQELDNIKKHISIIERNLETFTSYDE